MPAYFQRTVQVQLEPLSGCGACSASGGRGGLGGCGVQLLPVVPAPLIVACQLPDGAEVSIGDRVQVRLAEPDSDWLGAVARAYGSPIVGMIFGAAVGFWAAHALHVPQFTDGLSLLGFIAGLAGGLIAWCRAEKSVQIRRVNENQTQLHKVIQER